MLLPLPIVDPRSVFLRHFGPFRLGIGDGWREGLRLGGRCRRNGCVRRNFRDLAELVDSRPIGLAGYHAGAIIMFALRPLLFKLIFCKILRIAI
ncbi:hypothetical protein M427DRAFT_172030 [Gonapodya prolifera JEL478]|uniref:Uncharacterized protein n=1 Tax=Gonapodya prolifera (strain JEL478) TaxID=1344416 RepID=A0A139B0C2_GONPJ|nr:hypothetical protein M427DRAFT_172030 [Gonapodya prolifera JEL478]|eukprot:KXS22419.1 hypothetical protein M427DRAFT_172030 [Gonapodya prolifera JEL478]